MRKLILVLFLLSVSAIYAQRTIDLPIATAIDTLDRFTTLYRPSAPATLRQVTFKTVRDYFWTRINHWKNSNTWIDTVGVTTNLINVLLVKGGAGADAVVTAGQYITHVTNNDNTTAIGLYAKAMGGTTNYAAFFDSGSVFVKKDLFVADSTFKISITGNIKKWGNRAVEDIPLIADSEKVLYSNGKWQKVIADSAKEARWLVGGGVYSLPYQAKADSTLFFTPSPADTNKFLQFYSGGWRLAATGAGSSIDTTKISYLAKAETFTGAKTFNGDLIFGASADLTLPTADPTPNVGKLWRSTDVLKYTNSAGDAKTLTFGAGTINELAYWSSANSLGTLPVATYPSLTELSYVKGLSSAIQTQLSGKLTTGLTSANIFVGNVSNIATGVAMSGDATIANTGAVTVADDSHAHTGSTISGLEAADITSGTFTIARGGTGQDGTYFSATNFIYWDNVNNRLASSAYNSTSFATAAHNHSGVYEPVFTTLGISKGGTGQDGTYFSANNFVYWDNVNNRLASSGYSSSSFVPTTRTLTINGTGYDLSADRSWTVTTDQTAAYSWTGLHKFTSALLTSDTTGAYFNSYTATSGADIKGLTSYVYTSSNPTANKIYGGFFSALGSGTSGGSYTYGIYSVATGANTNIAGYFNAPSGYAGYFDNGMVYIKENLQVGTAKFIISTTGTLIRVNDLAASDYTNRFIMSDGTSYTPTDLFGRNNVWTGSTTFTPEGITYNTTIDATGKTCISGGGTGSGTTTTISNGITGQILILINTSSSYTWTLNETGNINLAGSADYVMGQSDMITLIYDSGTSKWLETSRSDN